MNRSRNEMIDNAQNRANEIGRHLSGNCTEAEVEALMQWKNESKENRAFYKEMESVWQITTPSEQLMELDLDMQWGRIADSIGPVKRNAGKLRRMYRTVAAAAAVGLLLFAISRNWNPSESSIQPVLVSAVQPDKNELVILPDNSKVWLRSGSEITYDSDFTTRNVTLKGEGFFEVTSDPDHPFTVHTEDAFVRVLGTRFNLKELNSGDVELFVEEGRVSFGQEERPASKILVTRDQVAVFRINTLKVEGIEVDDINRMSWKTGKLIFDNVILRDVLTDLERHYNIKFEVEDPDMLDCELKADFENTSKTEVIETIEFMMGWDILQKNAGYMITGAPCKSKEK